MNLKKCNLFLTSGAGSHEEKTSASHPATTNLPDAGVQFDPEPQDPPVIGHAQEEQEAMAKRFC